MGKKVDNLARGRLALFLVLIVFVMAIAGCETTKGAAIGAKKDWQTAQQGAQQGATNLWQAIQTADEWIKANLW